MKGSVVVPCVKTRTNRKNNNVIKIGIKISFFLSLINVQILSKSKPFPVYRINQQFVMLLNK